MFIKLSSSYLTILIKSSTWLRKQKNPYNNIKYTHSRTIKIQNRSSSNLRQNPKKKKEKKHQTNKQKSRQNLEKKNK